MRSVWMVVLLMFRWGLGFCCAAIALTHIKNVVVMAITYPQIFRTGEFWIGAAAQAFVFAIFLALFALPRPVINFLSMDKYGELALPRFVSV